MANFLKNTRLYLSGPIEFDNGINWRTEPIKILTERFGINIFDPYSDPKQNWTEQIKEARGNKDYDTMTKIAKGFVRKDMTMVDRSDFLIAYLPFKHATTGTHFEILNSLNQKKPTILICPQGKENIPVWYYGIVKHHFMFGDWNSLYEYLQEVDEGNHIDNHRWAFVYGLV